jgi:thiosulfate/3-mercaptopyruvate sulfurtransferase
VPPDLAAKINAWRAFFSRGTAGMAGAAPDVAEPSEKLPGLVDAAWLSGRSGREDVKVIDCRAQPNWNGGHIPGSTCMSPEHFRGAVKGIPASLLPVDLLARHMSLLGIRPRDTVVIVGDDKVQDATLIGLALERLGHRKYAVLQGGFSKWASEKLPLDTLLPPVPADTGYPADPRADRFSVDAAFVLERVRKGGAIILDVRPADYFTGKKSDEARAGHIPGAVNRPFSEDVAKIGDAVIVKPVEELAKAYASIIPSRDSMVIVHCRTGHQASQTYFVLKHLLGYRIVLWYGPGWTEWSARPELPVQKD